VRIFQQRRTVVCLLGALLLFAWLARAVTSRQAWVQRFDGPGSAAVTADGEGNVYVAGGTYATNLTVATIKYSSAGLPLWTNYYNGGAPVAIVSGTDEKVFVAVTSLDAYVILAYSRDGVPLWTNRYEGGFTHSIAAIGIDSSNSVIVTGGSFELAGFDFATIKYSSAGLPLWTNRYAGPADSSDVPVGMAVDTSGNIFVSGSSGTNVVTIAYSSSGVPLWTGIFHSAINGLAVDRDGNVIIAGDSYNGASSDFFLVKYSNAGTPQWTNYYNGPGNANDRVRAMAVDGSGNIFITGESYQLGTSYNYMTIACSGAGVPLWTNFYTGTGLSFEIPDAIAADYHGSIYVTGRSIGAGPGYDFVTLAYSGSGLALWTNRYHCKGAPDTFPEMRRGSVVVLTNGASIVTALTNEISSGSTNAKVTIVKYVSVPAALAISSTGPTERQLSFSGMPGVAYVTRFSTNLESGLWFGLSTNAGDSNGFWTVTDPGAVDSRRFYRALLP
jgi:hypothetical protein